MSALKALIGRLETSDGPCRELDEAIMAALYLRESRHIGAQEEQWDGSWAPVKQDVWVDPATGKWVSTHAREFTRSLDAAMSLVPEGRAWVLSNVTGCAFATVERSQAVGGATPALALCAAALRAREATHDR